MFYFFALSLQAFFARSTNRTVRSLIQKKIFRLFRKLNFLSKSICHFRMPDLKVVELFCGIGGFHQALIKAKKELKGYPTEVEFRLLSAMDINNNATSVYKLNHLKSEQCCRNGDINNAPWERTTGYNTLVMSPPCQPFSRNETDQQDIEICNIICYSGGCL